MSLILVIEDDPRIQRALRRQFSAEGYDVHIEGEGPSGLAACKSLRPVTVVLDLMLPGLSGRTVCKEIKAWCSDIPVIVLSSLPEKNRQKLIEAGAEEYLEKGLMTPAPGVNVLPKALENVICRVNRRRGIAFSSVPIAKES